MSESQLLVDLDIRYQDELVSMFDQAFVTRVLSAVADYVGQSGEVSVSLVNDDEIHELNRDYREVDRPTDVLSFAMLEGEELPAVLDVDVPVLLGDIVISGETAVRQARDYEHSVERELAFLLAHGFLHLIGYDHQTPEEEQKMFGIQEEVLQNLGFVRGQAAKSTELGQ